MLIDEREDNYLAKAFNLKTIYSNINNLDTLYTKQLKSLWVNSPDGKFMDIISYGRYVIIIQLSSNEDESVMLFLDLRNDVSEANELGNQLFPGQELIKTEFIKTFDGLRATYDRDYDEVQLVFVSPLSN